VLRCHGQLQALVDNTLLACLVPLMDTLLTPQRKRKSSDTQAYLASFSFDTLTGRLPSSRVGLMPCSVMMILAFWRREFSIVFGISCMCQTGQSVAAKIAQGATVIRRRQ